MLCGEYYYSGFMENVPFNIRDLNAEIKNDYSEDGLKILTRLRRDRYLGETTVGVNTIYFEEDYVSKVHLVRSLDDTINWIGVGPTDDRNKKGRKEYAALDFFIARSKIKDENYILSMDEEIGKDLDYPLRRLNDMDDFEREEVIKSLGLKTNFMSIKSNNTSFFIEEREEKRKTTDDDLKFVREVLERYKERDEGKYQNRINTLEISTSRTCALTCEKCESCSLLINQ